jgi:hypothetical protein
MHGGIFFSVSPTPCTTLDGVKRVCMDDLIHDVIRGDCLVYSFGIGNDWSFEVAMNDLGCEVRAFDPTISARTKPKGVYFLPVGIGIKSGTQGRDSSTLH